MAKFTPEIFEKICERIATSSDSIEKICSEFNISKGVIWYWIQKNKDFFDQYARAKEFQAEVLAEELIEIADNPKEGVTIVEKPNGVEITKGDMIQHRRLQTDTRKWLLSKLKPRKYGDRLDVTTNGEAMTTQTFFTLPDGTKLPI